MPIVPPMDLNALATDRARYSKARRGLTERGATLAECAAVAAWATTVRLREPASVTVTPAPTRAA